MTALESRGLFWWGTERVPTGKIAPNSCVGGLLQVDNDGTCSLNLDGYLPNDHGPMAAMVERELPEDRSIRGLLKNGEHTLLLRLTRNGGRMVSNGISSERYIASACLVSERATTAPDYTFKQLIVPLSGYEQWLRLRSLKVHRTRRTVSAKYSRPNRVTYRFTDGSLAFEFYLDGQSSGDIFGVNVSMKETASATFRFKKALDLNSLRIQNELFEDLLIMLTTTNYALDWPWVSSDDETRYRFYFRKLRERAEAKPPAYVECIAHFEQLRQHFGSTWLRIPTQVGHPFRYEVGH